MGLVHILVLLLSFFFMFWAVILVPELFRKLRENPGNNFHPVSYKSERGCPTDQKTDGSEREIKVLQQDMGARA